jgi:imidazolonepropionase-like amidohydrolase
VRGVRLPDGEPVEWWVAGAHVSETPIAGARDLPGGWVLPGGLVDAHVHRTMNFAGHPHTDGSEALVAANLAACRTAGVLAVRDTGLAWGGWPEGEPEDGPRVQSAGRLLAATGRGYPSVCVWVEPGQLVEAALADVRRGAAWVKVIADFPGPDGNWFAAPPCFDPKELTEMTRAVHDAGARVMAHSTGLAAGDLVRAGVDSIEHGMQLDGELLEQMARQGTAWSLTLATALKHVGPLAEQRGPVGSYIRRELARVREQLPLARQLGVPLLAGTDELPSGRLADEVTLLHEFGLTPAQAIEVASHGARDFLRMPAGPADLVTFDKDPRQDLAALACPQAVLFGGRRVA